MDTLDKQLTLKQHPTALSVLKTIIAEMVLELNVQLEHIRRSQGL